MIGKEGDMVISSEQVQLDSAFSELLITISRSGGSRRYSLTSFLTLLVLIPTEVTPKRREYLWYSSLLSSKSEHFLCVFVLNFGSACVHYLLRI